MQVWTFLSEAARTSPSVSTFHLKRLFCPYIWEILMNLLLSKHDVKKWLELSMHFPPMWKNEKKWLQRNLLPSHRYRLVSTLRLSAGFSQNSQVLTENEHLKRPSHPAANAPAVQACSAGEKSLYLRGLSDTSSTSVSPHSRRVSSSFRMHTQPREHELAYTIWSGFPGSLHSYNRPFPRQEPFPAASNLKSHVIQIV